jgi:hypothetical protein
VVSGDLEETVDLNASVISWNFKSSFDLNRERVDQKLMAEQLVICKIRKKMKPVHSLGEFGKKQPPAKSPKTSSLRDDVGKRYKSYK